MEEIKIHVEFGLNLSKVLRAMVDKTTTGVSDGWYYKVAFEQIKEAIVGAVRESIKGNRLVKE